MRCPIICVPFLPAAGMAIFPFILIKRKEYKQIPDLIYHEKIHFIQQLELLIVPFYVLYLLNYLVNLIRYRNHHQAYMNIVFEKEAYAMDSDSTYLSRRRLFAWISFL